MREIGIQRWQEGQEFEQKLQQNIDAEIVYEEGMKLFARGQFDEGIDRVEMAARATGLPRYNDRVQADAPGQRAAAPGYRNPQYLLTHPQSRCPGQERCWMG